LVVLNEHHIGLIDEHVEAPRHFFVFFEF